MVGYYSRFFEIERLKDTLSSNVVKRTKVIWNSKRTRFQERSSEYKQLTSELDILHTTSSLEYPQSTGLAEEVVQTAKNILQKATNDKEDPYLYLLKYQNTPVDNFRSPAQLLMSRNLCSILLVSKKKLEPKPPLQSTVVNKCSKGK